jgi:hypothetical protein
MLDVDAFLTTPYVMVDDFRRQSRPHKERRPGPDASLSPSEVVTLAIFARWSRFTSERDSYRYASSRRAAASCAMPSPLCPSAPSSIALCATAWAPSRRRPRIWRA